MPHPGIGYRRIAQLVLSVGQHQAGAVDREDRVRGLDDLVHPFLDPHLPEPQPAELIQSMTHILRRNAHARSSPVC